MTGIRFSEERAWRRKDLICWLGQPVRIDVETRGGLVVLTLTPLEGFIHLVADPAACIREYGSYHVSIYARGGWCLKASWMSCARHGAVLKS